jgi:phenylacetate-CoA ligase
MWYGVSRHDRWAILGGQLVTPVAQRRPPFWVWNAALHQLYMSTYHLAPEHLPAYIDALRQHRITYLWGYPSSLYELALGVLQAGRAGTLPLKVVITNAEPLLPYQRETIRKAFGCEVRETYGMAEIVAAASECETGRLHEWPEVGIVEVLEGGAPVLRGTTGDLVATGLLNEDMPLIRYTVGDRVSLSASRAPCPCGRTQPIVAAIEGRSDDTLVTRDGRRIGRLDPVFKAGLPIREAQIIQETFDRLRVRFVPAADFTPAAERALEQAIRARVGDMQIVLESLTSIPRTANGKFRAVICKIPPADRLEVPA